jgi:hypothetical protein
MPITRRTVAALGLAVLAPLSLSGRGHAQAAPMERVTGDDGRFTIDLPRGYTVKTSPRPDGGTMRQYSYMWKDAVGQFNVISLAVVDPSPGSTKQIDIREAQHALAARYPNSFLADSRDVSSGPAQGVAFAMTVASNRGYGPHTIAMRVYAMDGRLYEMLAATRVEDRDDPTVRAFMDSLRILR